ncbi:MAG: translational GTPase TypA [Planctomycetes bacterium]|nr:translational GTPase TypA [Planctomycetota bacterium]
MQLLETARRTDIRNVAIIAHVDHGKTTLVDGLLRQSGFFKAHQQHIECFMDSGELERERGITIKSKHVSIKYEGITINLIDTPGHADFGGEVERVLRMADGAFLLVDAREGPMPQTRFVLRKALAADLKIIVVINKIDRADQRAYEVEGEVFDLLVELGANHDQLEFKTIYASGRSGIAGHSPEEEMKDFRPLFDALVNEIPGPRDLPDEPLELQIAKVEYDQFVGRIGIGRIAKGKIETRSTVMHYLSQEDVLGKAYIKDLFVYDGIKRKSVDSASSGDIAVISGIDDIFIGDTISSVASPVKLPAIVIEKPTISMVFCVNDSPFAGREGKFVTSRHIRERLVTATLEDVAVKMEDTDRAEAWKISGRGVLHLGTLIETMRREGYEFQVTKPEVILRTENGILMEPMEEAVVEVTESSNGRVMEIMGNRRGEMLGMEIRGDLVRSEWKIPSRSIIGLRTTLLTSTSGEAVLYTRFLEYGKFKGDIPTRPRGVLISMMPGTSRAFALDTLQERSSLFVGAGEEIYEGMIVGEHCKEGDLTVNPCRAKELTNIRTHTHDKMITLTPPRRMSIEECLEFIDDDELLEITPVAHRMRKRFLKEVDRRRQGRTKGSA